MEGPYYSYPKFSECSFPEKITSIFFSNGELDSEKSIDTLSCIAQGIRILPDEHLDKLNISCDLPKIKTIDLSSYESYREIPIDWFKRFPTLEEVILPEDSAIIDDQVLFDNDIDYYAVFYDEKITHREIVRRYWDLSWGQGVQS